MNGVLAALLGLVALGVGILLGRLTRPAFKRTAEPEAALPSVLNRVLSDDDPDAEAVVDAAISDGSGDDRSRFAPSSLGALATGLRKRGHFDAAIRLRQHHLSVVPIEDRGDVELALAEDYLATGLEARAEALLATLAERRRYAEPARRLLLTCLERQRRWEDALAVGELVARRDGSVAQRLAHYACEIADAQLAVGDLRSCRHWLVQAQSWDRRCGRAELLLADVEIEAGRLARALKHLKKARQAMPSLVTEALPRVRKLAIRQSDDGIYQQFLADALNDAPLPGVIEELSEQHRRESGESAAFDFLLAQLALRPSAAGLLRALRRRSELEGDSLEQVRGVLAALAGQQPEMICEHCGSSADAFAWQCADCGEWAKLRPLEATRAR